MMSSTERSLDDYDAREVLIVQTWVEFVTDLLEVDLDNAERLRTALSRLIEKAQQVYPALIAGEKVQMALADLGPWPLPDDLGDVFVRLSGDFLFLGEDGPIATGRVMERHIDKIAGALIAKQGRTHTRSRMNPTDALEG